MDIEDLSYNYIHGSDIYLYQRKDMFRINSDTSLLAHFMKINEGERVLDIGTNNGALLLYSATFKPKKLVGIDILKEACELAEYNLKDCEIEHEIICGDASNYEFEHYDVVICNPPYFPYDENSHSNESKFLKVARHECYLTFDSLARQVAKILDTKGRFYFVHRSNRIQELLSTLLQYHLYAKRIQFIYDENKEEAIGVLVEACKDGGIHALIMPPIINKR